MSEPSGLELRESASIIKSIPKEVQDFFIDMDKDDETEAQTINYMLHYLVEQKRSVSNSEWINYVLKDDSFQTFLKYVVEIMEELQSSTEKSNMVLYLRQLIPINELNMKDFAKLSPVVKAIQNEEVHKNEYTENYEINTLKDLRQIISKIIISVWSHSKGQHEELLRQQTKSLIQAVTHWANNPKRESKYDKVFLALLFLPLNPESKILSISESLTLNDFIHIASGFDSLFLDYLDIQERQDEVIQAWMLIQAITWCQSETCTGQNAIRTRYWKIVDALNQTQIEPSVRQIIYLENGRPDTDMDDVLVKLKHITSGVKLESGQGSNEIDHIEIFNNDMDEVFQDGSGEFISKRHSQENRHNRNMPNRERSNKRLEISTEKIDVPQKSRIQRILQNMLDDVLAVAQFFLDLYICTKEYIMWLIYEDTPVPQQSIATLFSMSADSTVNYVNDWVEYLFESSEPHQDNIDPWDIRLETVLRKLGLLKYYPKKLTLDMVLKITKRSAQSSKPKTPEDLAWNFLHNVIRLNSGARESGLSHELGDVHDGKHLFDDITEKVSTIPEKLHRSSNRIRDEVLAVTQG